MHSHIKCMYATQCNGWAPSLRSFDQCYHHDGPQLHSPTAWSVLLKSRRICDHEVVLQVQRRCSQFNRYHKPHTQIAACTNRHIPHTTVTFNKPASKLRWFAMVCELQSWSSIACSTTLLEIQPISRIARTDCLLHWSPHSSPDRAVW